ncbi:MAG: hypothetical protein IKA00_05430 [Prevotella sp.]|nr:hypothetical protein [Prevotella sp.]MBR2034439.1 hypothetical protein [Prevotella sp.]
MNKKIKEVISKELGLFYCSILLEEVRDKIRKLKSYGIEDIDIESVLYEKEEMPQLIITEKYEVIMVGKEQLTIEMEPLVKAVYLLFLLHPEGIILKCLPDYKKELTTLYLQLRPTGLTERVRKSISDITDPTHNSINEKCARIRKAFSVVLPKGIAKHYYISGKRGMTKKIDIARTNIIWNCTLPNLQRM